MNRTIILSILMVSIAFSISFCPIVLNYTKYLYDSSLVSCHLCEHGGTCICEDSGNKFDMEYGIVSATAFGLCVIPVIVAIELISIIYMKQKLKPGN